MARSTLSLRHIAALSALALVFAFSIGFTQVRAATLKPFKDDLFGYGRILDSRDDGNWLTIDYDEMRDINGRDEIPERRVKRPYVSLGVKRQQANETVDIGGRGVDVFRVGAAQNAAFTVIFIHGRGGDRRLGANDYSFGGNFNRLKNLAVENGGAYYAPSARSFDTDGAADIAGLIDALARRSPGKPVILSCASMGSFLCWGVTRNATAVGQLSGIMIMGGATDPDFGKSAAFARKLPMFFSHGSADGTYKAEDQAALYGRLKKGGYPARFVLFQTGTHGTPVRMTDWRDAINWILSR
ncbi:alpha/beta fold hydrolase [Rhizobium sp. DKSPLA3]|uniref:Alpha/beta fold hydrolase n=1 Tax=Rhizobium quercicola TaxID=2901226 RepID=A0A9X1NW08_9HYPH|nr:alpha/beta fold hydrolase [Rhizobium quercicola]MCD7110331.1 alpha/beta fold hydrolase [Rhizobium quercicola]